MKDEITALQASFERLKGKRCQLERNISTLYFTLIDEIQKIDKRITELEKEKAQMFIGRLLKKNHYQSNNCNNYKNDRLTRYNRLNERTSSGKKIENRHLSRRNVLWEFRKRTGDNSSKLTSTASMEKRVRHINDRTTTLLHTFDGNRERLHGRQNDH